MEVVQYVLSSAYYVQYKYVVNIIFFMYKVFGLIIYACVVLVVSVVFVYSTCSIQIKKLGASQITLLCSRPILRHFIV